jgi:predicted nucleic acid-binding protein
MVLVDTTAWIDYIHGVQAPHTDALDYELSRNNVVTGDLIIAEFLQGFRYERDYEAAKEIMDSLIYYDMVGKDIAHKSALHYRFLQSKGITVRKTIDMIIGTFCMEHDFPLIHNDRDFDYIAEYLELRIYKR